MKILFLTNNEVSKPLADWLISHPENYEVVVHNDRLTTQYLIQLNPHLVISYSYGQIIKADVLEFLPNKFINLHISYLPYNRGADPNAWSILEDTPKGVSIHLIDKGIDTGNILIQKQVYFNNNIKTLRQSYSFLHEEIQKLFQENWDNLKNGAIQPIPQVGIGTFHKTKEFAHINSGLLGEEGWDVTIELFKSRFKKSTK